jgi:hypothetical protein
LEVEKQKGKKQSIYFQNFLLKFRTESRDNDYLIAKWHNTTPDAVREWFVSDWLGTLEEILKEGDRRNAK